MRTLQRLLEILPTMNSNAVGDDVAYYFRRSAIALQSTSTRPEMFETMAKIIMNIAIRSDTSEYVRELARQTFYQLSVRLVEFERVWR